MMDANKFEDLKAFIRTLMDDNSIEDLVAEIYNLYQEYLISEKQELELYWIVDPDDVVSCPCELWYDEKGCDVLFNYAYNL